MGQKNCILDLDFSDFEIDNKKYRELEIRISKAHVIQSSKEMLQEIEAEDFGFHTVDLKELSEIFGTLHQMIWRIE